MTDDRLERDERVARALGRLRRTYLADRDTAGAPADADAAERAICGMILTAHRAVQNGDWARARWAARRMGAVALALLADIIPEAEAQSLIPRDPREDTHAA